MGKGQKLYNKAKKIIPGGTMLLSKRPEMFLPELWPSYYSKAKGSYVWDLDGNKLLDMSIMGIGTNTLGYGNDLVDKAVSNVVKKGNMSTLNSVEEIELSDHIKDASEPEPKSNMKKKVNDIVITNNNSDDKFLRIATASKL